MHCLECGSEVTGGFRFCGNCGALLPESGRIGEGRDDAEQSTDSSVSAARELPPDAAVLAEDDGDRRAAPIPDSLRSRAVRLLAAAAVLGLVGTGVTWFAKDRPYDPATAGAGTATNNGIYAAPLGRDLAEIRWRRDQPGSAYSALGQLVIATDRVYVANAAAVSAVSLDAGAPLWRAELPGTLGLTTDGEQVFLRGPDRLHALDSRTGELRWTRQLTRGVYDAAERVAPLRVGDAVHVVTPTGALRSFTTEGEERWSLEPRELVEAGSEPRLVSGLVRAGAHLVTLAWGQEEWGRATAIDPDTGDVVWATNVGATLPHPPVSVGGALVVVGPGQLIALDIRSGDVRWRRDLPLDTAGDALVAAVGGHVVVLTNDGSFQRFDWSDGGQSAAGTWDGSSPLRIAPAGNTVAPGSGGVVVHTADGEVAAYDVVAGMTRWRAQVGVPSAPSATAGRLVVTPTESGTLAATSETSGEVVWTAPIRSSVSCNVSGGNDLTYLVLPDGPIHAFDTATGSVRWSLEDSAGSGLLSADAVRAAVLDGGLVRFLDPQSGAIEQSGSAGGGTLYSVGLSTDQAVAVGGNPVGLGGGTGWVRSIDTGTARSRWLTYLDAPPAARAAIAGDSVIVATGDGSVMALSAVSGRELWRYDGSLPATSAPVLAGELVVVSDLAGGLIVLSLEDGTVVWQQPLGLPLRGEPVVADGIVVVRGDEQRLVALDLQTGQRLWDTAVSQDMTSPPAIAGTRAYVGTRAGLAVFDLSTGDQALNLPLGAPVVAAPVLSRHGAVVCLANGSILALGL